MSADLSFLLNEKQWDQVQLQSFSVQTQNYIEAITAQKPEGLREPEAPGTVCSLCPVGEPSSLTTPQTPGNAISTTGRKKKKAISPDPHDLSWPSSNENMSTQISSCCNMNMLHNWAEIWECGEDLLKLAGTNTQSQSVKLHPHKHTSQSPVRLQNIHHTTLPAPADYEANVLTAADSCLRCLLENLFALPSQGEGASPPFWLLFSAPALSQHSVSSSQSPCQQDFTQWAGELQCIAQLNTHTQACKHTSFTLLTGWSTNTFRT